ncbi:Precorrin-6Y C(5,15)-methyltransferase [decarboxylating] [Rosistilla oblonga]|uniref:precorrin-6y C5,15-methyltransferase (decarboxylating) subunit CbiE n=1 Tax=Rosistilla oblonga TaxID=2527990 RepID=UPI00118C148A|nr:precorrin-6y C5,15-methyltransferase (decarboxylating) subunit CbiE [Rosistilla oblonga]QDV13732.1 Precorrin-6Y C(5,15)-methyltransferase [decarboxylating] [Rosistilla oblonga]
MNKIQIVGVGDDGVEGLTNHARALIEAADVLVGPANLLPKVAIGPSERIESGSDLQRLGEMLNEMSSRNVVLLAGGDPLFYGTARFLCDSLGKDLFEVVPHVSSMQLAFARVKESWDDAYLTNLATQPLDRVVERIRTADRVGLFTTEEITPAALAAALLDRRIDYFNVYVCENLGSPDERVTQGDLNSLQGQTFGPLNVMVLVRRQGVADRPQQMEGKRLFGNPDDQFLQSKPKRGLLTPMEVRCIALALMDLGPTSIVWDVGAGSGSLAIEASQIVTGGQVYAIEMDAEDFGLMTDNAERYGCSTLIPVHGQAPEALAALPDPDVIFVGGTGRAVGELVDTIFDRLRPGGRFVVNVASPDNLVGVQAAFQRRNIEPSVRMANIARGNYQLDRLRFEAVNPSFLICGTKP